MSVISKVYIAIACMLYGASSLHAGFIPPEVVGTVGNFLARSNVVQEKYVLISTVDRPGFGLENSYGILEFRVANLPDPISNAWLMLAWNAIEVDIVVDLTVSGGDGQLALNDFVLGQPVLSYLPYPVPNYRTYIDITHLLQEARARNEEFVKFTLSTQMSDRFVSYAVDQLGIVTDFPTDGPILITSVPEPSGIVLTLLGLGSLSCWSRNRRNRVRMPVSGHLPHGMRSEPDFLPLPQLV